MLDWWTETKGIKFNKKRMLDLRLKKNQLTGDDWFKRSSCEKSHEFHHQEVQWESSVT